jgi:glycosyltransferase involved in cell wall biosynthesis
VSNGPTRIPLLCRIRPRPASIRFRAWRARLDEGRNLLDRCAEHLAALFPEHRLVFVADEVDAGLMDGRIPATCDIVRSPYWLDVDAVLDAAFRLGADMAMVAHLETVLCPPDLPGRLVGAIGTAALAHSDLPRFVGPELVRIRPAIAARQVTPDDHCGATFADLFSLVAAAGVDIPGGGTVSVGAAPDSHVDLRERVSFESASGVELLGAVLRRPAGRLKAWASEHARSQRTVRDTVRTAASAGRGAAPSGRGRVLFVSNPSAFSGAEAITVELARGLRREHVDVAALVAFEGELTARLRRAGVQVYCANRELADDTIAAWHDISHALHEFAPELVHDCGRSGQTVLHAAAAMGCPVVYHGHIPVAETYVQAAGWADRYIAVSASVARAMTAAGIDEAAIRTVANGIDAAPYEGARRYRNDVRRDWGVAHDAFLVVTLSRLSPEKRLHDLVDAIAVARDRGTPAELLIGGEGMSASTTRVDLMRQIATRGLGSVVRLAGYVPDVVPLLGAADGVAICSDYEGLPVLALEAMAAGVPLIGTAAGGLADLVGEAEDSDVSGIRVQVGSPTAIAAAIELLHGSPELSAQLGGNGVARVHAEFSAARMVERTRQVYRELLPTRPDRSRKPSAASGTLQRRQS